MHQITAVEINFKGFHRLFSVRFYIQMARAQLKYDLAVIVLNLGHLRKLESCHNECIYRIFSDSSKFSVNVMLRLVQQSSMVDRVSNLRLWLPISVKDAMSFILNKLLLKKFRSFHETSAWSVRLPAAYIILHEMDYLFHDQTPLPLDPGAKVIHWLSS
ncbi:hypothetical protein G6F43_001077 [Rhizopus delemar]|nr:hypothetical protein G6F43_001077 [Rhizopus delemar]